MFFPNLRPSRGFARRPSAAVTLPMEPAYAMPSDEPALQAGMDPFTPTFTGTSPAGPVLSRVTPIGKADRVIKVAGYGFGEDFELWAYGESAAGHTDYVQCERTDLDGDTAEFILPDTIPTRAFILAYPKNSNGTGLPLPINAPEVKTLNADTWGGPSCLAGATCYLGGRSLSSETGEPTLWIYLQPEDGEGQFVTPTSVSRGEVSFTVPDLPVGSYRVWTHNGKGGIYGWHRSRTDLVVTTAAAYGRDYSGASVNLSTYTAIHGGGPGSGVSVRTAWLAAFAALNDTGGIVNGEAGHYVTDGDLSLTSGANLSIFNGAGKDITFIETMDGYTHNPSYGMFPNGDPRRELRNLTIDVTNGLGDVSGRIFSGGCLRNVKINSYNRNTSCVSNDVVDGTIWDNCDFWGGLDSSQIAGFNDGKNVLIRNCTFQMANYAEGAIWFFFAANNVLITGCSATGQGGGRFVIFAFQSCGTTVHDCTVSLFMDGPDSSGKGEKMMLGDGGSVLEAATATAGTSTTVSIPIAGAGNRATKYLVVVGGKGIGQFAQIVSSATVGSEKIHTLDREFLVTTDATSRIYICNGTQDSVVCGNTISGEPGNVDASTGWIAFGPSAGIDAFDNAVSDCNWSYTDWALTNPGGAGNCPSIWHNFFDNTFSGNNNGPRVLGSGLDSGQEIGLSLSVHRDNTFSGLRVKDSILHLNTDSNVSFDHITVLGDGANGLYEGESTNGGRLFVYKSLFDLGDGTFAGSKAIDDSEAGAPTTIVQVPASGQFVGFES